MNRQKMRKDTPKFGNLPLYHGTSSKNVEKITRDGFEKPKHLRNWLGCGVYFSVDNFLLAASYALKQAEVDKCDGVIIEIEKPKWESLEGRILDLTSDRGILELYKISKEFSEIIDMKNIQNIEDLRNAPIYDPQLKIDVSISLLVFSSLIQNILDFMQQQKVLQEDPIIRGLIDLSKVKLFSTLIDWYTYYKSGGNPSKIPFKAVISIFNAGDPVLLRASGLWHKDFKRFRKFYDYVNFIQRIEASFLLFGYYTNENVASLDLIGRYRIYGVERIIKNNEIMNILKEQDDEL